MSVEKTKYGTWRVRWRDDTGRQVARTFKRKIDAERFERSVLTDLTRGEYVSLEPTKQTVRQVADEWLAGAMNLGQGGRDTYRRDLDRYILPILGDLPLGNLRAEHIDRFLADELANLAASTVHRHYRTIRRLCQFAVERGKLKTNPCNPVRPPKVEHTEMRFLTVEQVDALAAAIGGRYRAWVYVAVYGGLRWSETVGLRRGNVDGARISVVEQLIRRADGKWYSDPPKTRAGRRTVTVPAFVADELAQHLDAYVADDSQALVFANGVGNPMVGPSFTGNVFKPALERAGIDRAVRIHDLRHTAVALAIKAGAHPKAIQARMGHASISVTMDRYGHLYGDMDAELANALGALRVTPDAEVRPHDDVRE